MSIFELFRPPWRWRARAWALWQQAQSTPREREVPRLVDVGQQNKEIARIFVPPCGPRSLETHRADIYSKLQCTNDNELGALAGASMA